MTAGHLLVLSSRSQSPAAAQSRAVLGTAGAAGQNAHWEPVLTQTVTQHVPL